MANDNISIIKSVLWEEAKGKLRALSSVSGQHSCTINRFPNYQEVEKAIEIFIKDFEDNCYNE